MKFQHNTTRTLFLITRWIHYYKTEYGVFVSQRRRSVYVWTMPLRTILVQFS